MAVPISVVQFYQLMQALETRRLFSTGPVVPADSTALPAPPDIVHTVIPFPDAAAKPTAGVVGTTAVFGSTNGTVYLYHTDTGKWSTARFPQATFAPDAATVVGNLVLFAGASGGAGQNGVTYDDVVDIFNVANGHWSTKTLAVPRQSIGATSVGSEAFFAGGSSAKGESAVVDVYDADKNEWATTALSQARDSVAAVSVGKLAIFAGGFFFGSPTPIQNSSVVDVLDTSTGHWSQATTSFFQRGDSATTVVNGKAIFAGGSDFVPTSNGVVDGTHNVVKLPAFYLDVYDSATGQWSSPALPDSVTAAKQPIGHDATALGRYALIDSEIGQTGLTAWDTNLNQWFALPDSGATRTAVTVGSTAFFAGGSSNLDAYSIKTVAATPAVLTGTISRVHKGYATIALRNTGGTALAASFTVSVYASKSATLDGTAALIGTTPFTTSIPADNSESLALHLSVPKGLAKGSYHLLLALGRKHHLTVVDSSLQLAVT